ncbi:hypothetical protein M8C21_021478, partial [Ambrosia artemisiifolia]
FREYLKTERK